MNNFQERLNIIAPMAILLIASIDELRDEWTGDVKLNLIVLSRLQKSSLLTSAGASTRIEGSKLPEWISVFKLSTYLPIQHK